LEVSQQVIKLTRKQLQDLDSALLREWIETNGLGGYACSTVLGLNTRKYHSLLTVSKSPPIDRVMLVSHLDETVIINGVRLEISSNEYEDIVFPEGYRYLDEVRLDPYPVFSYVVGGVRIEKSIFMAHHENTTFVTYSIETLPNGPRRSQVALEIRPLLAFRDHHGLSREAHGFDSFFDATRGNIRFEPFEEMPPVNISFEDGRFEHDPYWYKNFRYRREHESGYPCNEDIFSPGRFMFFFEDRASVSLAFSTEPHAVRDIAEKRAGEIERRSHLADMPFASGELARHLLGAADAFVVKRGEEHASIIAGYPWFTDWGRDTMISLPGLMLATGRIKEARGTIEAFIANMKYGLIPNRFPDLTSEAEYNTIDATLWLFEAVRRFYDATGDGEFVTTVLPGLREAIAHHIEGTRFGIRVDEDGLLQGGADGVQLTWMDAKVGGKVITARIGKPVEINALWYNALRITADFCSGFGGLAEESKYDLLAHQAFESFNAKFWNEGKGCLYDYIGDGFKNDAVRPNQIFAMSLTYPILEHARWRTVVDVVERELLTPYGLRTLSPLHPDYKGRYGGDLETRDHAYHQGTVWPWLLGPFVKAYLRAYGRSGQTVAYCLNLLQEFKGHLSDAGLGTVSEIFDGDPPHRPSGCIAQAWSVAEILRILAEDLFVTTNSSHNHPPALKGDRPLF
jgi:predicted glycogen debranching enzyme